ncbi:MAG: ABC-F family ATP-binding cassette domain-containing protein [Clostridia bacterium]|nr:ABC-F family ATP-binding cassette domain-containing protein [Clostridia bacterium]
MSDLQFNKITKYFSYNLILDEASFSINSGEKVALAGVNGSGKTTVMKLITGEIEVDSGNIYIAAGRKTGYSEQHTYIDINSQIFDYVISSFSEVLKMREELKKIENIISKAEENELDKILAQYGAIREEYEKKNGYAIEAQTRKILTGLGFSNDDFNKKCQNLSGGEKRRLSLAKLLVSQPDILLLDEPTNHLDLDGIQWLEDYLSSYPGTILVISHDSYFLDKVVTRVLEVSNKKITSYPGNYTKYQILKMEKETSDKKAFEKQQKEIRSIQEYIKKYKAGIKSKQARGREKQLSRRELLNDVFQNKNIKLRFGEVSHTGKEILKIKNLSKFIHPELEFKDLTFLIKQGEATGIIGPNGSGKTTLINTIINKSQDKGDIIFGAGVKAGYFDQHHSSLDPEKTVFQEITENFNITFEKAREMLASVLFFQEDLDKKIKSLSGGEKSRVAFIKLILEEPNFLILDEPTNHLDIESKNIIIQVLSEFEGTILFVSHDRLLLDLLATRLMIIKKGKVEFFEGSFSEYGEEKQKNLAELNLKKSLETDLNKGKEIKAKGINIYKVNQRLEELELLIEEADRIIAECSKLLSDPEIYKDFQRSEEISSNLKINQKLSEEYMEEWADLQGKLEDHKGGKL